jgi:dolichol kinase
MASSDFDWRKTLIQAIGLVLGFSLAFLGNWSLSDGEWELIHIPALVCLVGGNATLIACLYRLTMPKYRRRKESGYEVHMFTAGAALVLVGFLASVVAAWIVGY